MRYRLALFIATCFGLGTLNAFDDVAVDKLPKAITATLKKRFPKGEIVSASKSGDQGKETYEVSVKEGSLKADVNLSAVGSITGMEKQISEKDLPNEVSAAVKAKYPKGTIKLCEEVISVKDGKETLDYFEVTVEIGDKKSVELEIETNGKIKKENTK